MSQYQQSNVDFTPNYREAIMTWADTFEIADSSWTAFQRGMGLVIDYQ